MIGKIFGIIRSDALITVETCRHFHYRTNIHIVMIPPGCVHGFGGKKGGMNCLSVQFDKIGGLYENPKEINDGV